MFETDLYTVRARSAVPYRRDGNIKRRHSGEVLFHLVVFKASRIFVSS